MIEREKYKVFIYPPSKQGIGEFDNGKITEIKPIDFPHGTSESKRIGPLFYWAWASANGEGVIAMHPHQAFEIMSYVIKGEIDHSDTLGNKSRVGDGGAQVMQAGNGIYHQEEMYGERTEFFQIWFDPDLRKSIEMPATYNQFTHKDFPFSEKDGVSVKHILGNSSPVTILANIKMDDVLINSGGQYVSQITGWQSIAMVNISGTGELSISNEIEYSLIEKDFVVIQAEGNIDVNFQTTNSRHLRLVIIEIPTKVDYPLYGEQ